MDLHTLAELKPQTKRPFVLLSTYARGIVLNVARRHGVTLDELTGPGRTRRIADARFEAMYELRRTGRYSYPKIGHFFGGRDHTSVINAVRRHEEALAAQRLEDAA